jgi:hypothetical protein
MSPLIGIQYPIYGMSWIQNIFKPPRSMKSVMKAISFVKALRVGYNEIIRASEDARGVDFSRRQQEVTLRVRGNPLSSVFLSLKKFLVSSSAEAIDLSHAKTRSRTPSPKKRTKISNQAIDEEYISHEVPLAQTITVPSSISPPMTPRGTSPPTTPLGKKRVSSGESYGFVSTETTPNKINHPESLIQALQNRLIETLIEHVWRGAVNVLWAQNRYMYLDYRPYHSNSSS